MHKSKMMIADSFSQSAERYDQAAKVQQHSGIKLLEIMQEYVGLETNIRCIADVGCGTGFFTQHLINHYAPEQYIGIDLSQGMLDVAAKNNSIQNHGDSTSSQRVEHIWCCDDAENLQLASESVDMIYSNFALQWCDDLDQLTAHFKRVLVPGGICCFTSLGSQTLHELRDAWAQVDGYSHVNQFYDHLIWHQAITKQEFSIIHHSNQMPVVHYPTVKALLRSLKDIGANVVTGDRHRALMGKEHFFRFVDAYEQFHTTAGYPASYDVDTWIIQKAK